jgi:hypothetical protein
VNPDARGRGQPLPHPSRQDKPTEPRRGSHRRMPTLQVIQKGWRRRLHAARREIGRGSRSCAPPPSFLIPAHAVRALSRARSLAKARLSARRHACRLPAKSAGVRHARCRLRTALAFPGKRTATPCPSRAIAPRSDRARPRRQSLRAGDVLSRLMREPLKHATLLAGERRTWEAARPREEKSTTSSTTERQIVAGAAPLRGWLAKRRRPRDA